MLTKLMSFTLMLCLAATTAFTQAATTTNATMTTTNTATTEVEAEDYERLLDAYLTVTFREYAYESLDLTSEEIIALDPVYLAYMKEKDELHDKRVDLIKEYAEEIADDDMEEEMAEEAPDMIETFFEINSDVDELRKNYFDRMEDVIPYEKAFAFFLIEQDVENRLMRERLISLVPVVVEIENDGREMGMNMTGSEWESPEIEIEREWEAKSGSTAATEMDHQHMWSKNNHVSVDGKVALDHQFTYNGLLEVTNTIKAAASAVDADIDDLDDRTQMIMDKAAEMQVDPYEDTHADKARVAFIAVAELVADLSEAEEVEMPEEEVEQLRIFAERIDPEILYMDQATRTYVFFTQAEKVLNEMKITEFK